MAVAKICARDLANAPFPELPPRVSQRLSRSCTQAVSPRTVSSFERWPGFWEGARALVASLDDNQLLYLPPMERFGPLRPASDEADIRHALEDLFITVDSLAGALDIPFKFTSAGSGRKYSCTDIVLLDTSAAQEEWPRPALSMRVFGNGEAKGNWQFLMQDSEELEHALNDPKQVKKVTDTIQQMFGDMVLDESKYGFVSNYNQTIFFRRAADASVKTLEYSPVVKIGSTPLAAFLYVLVEAYNHRGDKNSLGRSEVPDTPSSGYVLTFPPVIEVTSTGRRRTRRTSSVTVCAKRARTSGAADSSGTEEVVCTDGKHVSYHLDVSNLQTHIFTAESFHKLPAYSMKDIGLTGRVTGVGRYGNVLEGRAAIGVPLAIKIFNLYQDGAAEAFVKEQMAYHALKELQGDCVPFLFAVGRLPHCNVVYLALSDCGTCNLRSVRLTNGRRKSLTQILGKIHKFGVLHNDLKPSNILLCDGMPTFIDFEQSEISVSTEAFQNEDQEMEDMLASLVAEIAVE